MSVFHENMLIGSSGQGAPAAAGISRSLRFNSSDSAYLSRTPASAGNRKTWTWAGWVKRSALATRQIFLSDLDFNGDNGLIVEFDSSDCLNIGDFYSSTYFSRRTTTQVFRDPSAWQHIVISYNTTDATAGNRLRVYVNGAEVTAFSNTVNPSQNYDGSIGRTNTVALGRAGAYPGFYYSGYLADVHFIDGQALDPTSFTEVSATTGQLIPKQYSGSYGTNGFKLDFADNSAATAAALGKDSSGNNNHWTPNNLSINTGGPTSVAAASGALPIYNTTDTYGATKGSGTRTDPNASSLVLAISMDGTNGGTTFTDDSPTIRGSGSAKTITRFNATTSSASSKFYGSSGAFNGTNAYLSLADSPDWAFGTSDFTVETWAYVNPGSALFFGQGDGGSPAWVIYGNLHLGPGIWSYNFGPSTPTGRWFHWAMVRQGTSVWFYIDGVQYGPYTGPSSWPDSGDAFTIGQARFSYTNGYYQDFRIYKGVAKYTTNFNPPSATQNATVAAGNDSLVDTPTSYGTDTGAGGEVRGNYCTWNALAKGSDCTLSNGNLDVAWGSAGSTTQGSATIGMSSGKWYWETTITASSASPTNAVLGITTKPFNDSEYPGYSATSWGYRGSDGQKWTNTSGSSYGASYANGDVVGVAFDADNGTLTFYKNGSSQGTAFTGLTSGPYFPAIGDQSSSQTFSAASNFGQRPFAYAAPSGFKALCDTNLPAPVVAKPSTVMDVKLYTGNGSTQTISGLGFSPDLVWIKKRNSGGYGGHYLTDIIRGGGAIISTNATSSETSYDSTWKSLYGQLSAFTNDGFTVVDGSSSVDDEFNGSSGTYVAWTWDAGTSTVTNTQGSITSQVRANQSAGFSVVTYTVSTSSQTAGHGLGVTPSFVLCKRRNGTSDWYFQSVIPGASGYLFLNSTAALTSASYSFNSTTFQVAYLGGSGEEWVAYCFAPVAGYSNAFSFVGNGSTDGPAVWLGFRPRFVILKASSSTSHWHMMDSARQTYNQMNTNLFANLSNAELSDPDFQIDFLSNGFKLRTSGPSMNGSGVTYIGYAWAESPFQFARAR